MGLKLNTPSSGSITLNPTDTASNYTLTLPAASGSLVAADGSGNATISGSLTLSGGTANGVAYLNGSKVLTTGSALTFDGTNLGIGNAPTTYKVEITTSGNNGIKLNAGTAGADQLYVGNTGGLPAIGTISSSALTFIYGGSEQMRLTSTGLGIGTSSPAQKLHVSGNILGTGFVRAGSGSASAPAFSFGSATNTGIWNYDDGVGPNLKFTISGTDYLTLDRSGNLGLGVTPSAWSTSYNQKAIQFGPVGSLMSFQASTANNQTFLNSNAVNLSGGWTYLYSDFASQYRQYAGTHVWQTAPSGTAGNAISFTQAMTLDASGNLLVGTTSGGASANAVWVSPSNSTIRFDNTTASGKEWSIGTSSPGIAPVGDYFAFARYSGSSWAEYARIDSSGNLLVGNTAADTGSRLHVTGASATSADFAMVVDRSTGADILACRNDGNIWMPSVYGNTTGVAVNMVIGSDGALYRSTSSLKYKTNVKNAAHGLSELLTLRPVTYEGKAEADAGKTFGGLIAEEVHEAGLTEFVQYAEDGSPDALAYGNMVSLCIKAIQEQQAIIESLQAELDQLKAKVN